QLDVADAARHEHAERNHLVDRSVGGIAAAVGGGEQHLALRFRGQPACQRAGHFVAGACRRVVGPLPELARNLHRQRRVHRAAPAAAGGATPRRNWPMTASHLARKCVTSNSRIAAASRACSASIIFSCSFIARFHFSPSWLERKRSACSRALTWL